MKFLDTLRILSVNATFALLTACGGGGTPPPAVIPSTPTITSISLNPTTANLQVGATQTFTATVSGTGSFDSSVSWSSNGGSFSSISGSSTTYTAPSSPGPYTITVRSVQDSSKQTTATVTVASSRNSFGMKLGYSSLTRLESRRALCGSWRR